MESTNPSSSDNLTTNLFSEDQPHSCFCSALRLSFQDSILHRLSMPLKAQNEGETEQSRPSPLSPLPPNDLEQHVLKTVTYQATNQPINQPSKPLELPKNWQSIGPDDKGSGKYDERRIENRERKRKREKKRERGRRGKWEPDGRKGRL